ncbi:hypothetical protein [uncultured Nostoc sp.]|uniref:hypothetical protein n=1 Tax=uncultured Nostoc sp. TaxID=340711 RepID=UPI0035CAD767
MNHKEYAKSRKLTLKQFNDLSKLVLGTGTSASGDLDDEQISKLDAAIAAAAEQVNALSKGNSPAETIAGELPQETSQEANALATSGNNGLKTSSNTQVIEILGEDLLRRNMAIFMTHHIRSLQRVAETHKAILNKFEQEVYSETAETFARMTRKMEDSFTDINRIAKPQTEEDKQLYQDYISLVEEFLSPPNP